MISATTFIGCIGYLFYDWRREKGDGWALRFGRASELLKRILKLWIDKTSYIKKL